LQQLEPSPGVHTSNEVIALWTRFLAGATHGAWSYNLPVRVVKHISISLFALVLTASAAAQMRNPPPASIYSVGGTALGGPPASIYSLPSQPVGLGRNFGIGRNFGTGRTCCAIGINVGGGQRQGQGRRQHRNTGVIGYPVYYPIYPYDGYSSVDASSDALPGAGTFDRPRYNEDTAPASANAPEPRLRNDRADDDSRYGDHYLDSRDTRPPAPTPAIAPPAQEPTQEGVATTLIFRDGHRLEVRNYAIMGSTLFILTPERRKVPLTDLDLQATARANDDRGVDFRVPAGSAE
jgi:hypothetical protein